MDKEARIKEIFGLEKVANAKALTEHIGKRVNIAMEKMIVTCMIEDARIVWGNVQVLVSPIEGSGQQWVSEDRIIPV